MKAKKRHYRHKKKAHPKKFHQTLKDVLTTLAAIVNIIKFIISIAH